MILFNLLVRKIVMELFQWKISLLICSTLKLDIGSLERKFAKTTVCCLSTNVRDRICNKIFDGKEPKKIYWEIEMHFIMNMTNRIWLITIYVH